MGVAVVLAAAIALIATACATGTEAEPHRPIVHYAPAQHWMNDPNGPVYLDGEYHLFYQYNPRGSTWGNIAWGHAVSDDRLAWEELDVAIPSNGSTLIFSGSAVADTDNTSGLCTTDDCLVAIYTAHVVEPGTTLTRQAQHLAYSNDAGRTWQQFDGNPVLDEERAEFRDPNVTWHDASRQWVMAVALPLERRIAFYGSADLRHWDLLSEFGPAGALGGIWECPVLMELPVDGDPLDTRWILKVDLNPGHVAGGSGAQYFVGDFDGVRFTVAEPAPEPLWVDYGPDFYCAMQWSNEEPIDGARSWIAWMSNWVYAEVVPTSPWRGTMTLPQLVELRSVGDTLRITRRPVPALDELRRRHVRIDSADLDDVRNALREDVGVVEAADVVARLELGTASSVALRVHASGSNATVIGYDAIEQRLSVDRRSSGIVGFHPAFAAAYEAPLDARDGALDLRIVVDRGSVEVFAEDGMVGITALVFPGQGGSLDLVADGGSLGRVEIDAWELGAP